MAKPKITVHYVYDSKEQKYFVLEGNRRTLRFSTYKAMRKAFKSTVRLVKRK